jgi:hypothetical protein
MIHIFGTGKYLGTMPREGSYRTIKIHDRAVTHDFLVRKDMEIHVSIGQMCFFRAMVLKGMIYVIEIRRI